MLGEAHSVLGIMNWSYNWDWPATENELRLALELTPNYMEGHAKLALYLGWSGRRAEALQEIARVRALDPARTEYVEYLGAIYYLLRDYRAMVELCQPFVASDPNDWLGHYFLAVGYEGQGKPLQAIPEYQRAVELSEGDQDPAAALAHAYAVIGRRTEAGQILRELQRKPKTNYVPAYMIATIYAGLNDKGRAFDFLEKAYQERSWDLPYFLNADLRIDTLRSDPRFADLRRRVGLSQ
jgi:tetratricopeptide (TPR) repeat protein